MLKLCVMGLLAALFLSLPGAPAAPEAAAQAAGGLCRKGAKVEAAWGISWYAATVLENPDAQGKCMIHFDGYDKMWDIAVAQSGLRAKGGGDVYKPVNPVSDKPVTGKGPNGTYSCHKISGSALIGLGNMTVSGGTPSYRGLPNGSKLKGISYKGKDYRGRDLMVIEYTSPSGWAEKIDCVK